MKSKMLSYFTGCWFLDFFVLKVCGHIRKRLSTWRRLFLLNDYNSMATSFVTKETLYNLTRFLLVFILIHGNDKHDSFLVQLVLNGLTEAPVRVRPCECHVFELFVFEHSFEK